LVATVDAPLAADSATVDSAAVAMPVVAPSAIPTTMAILGRNLGI
jgi:hypothetical protein